MIRSMVGAALLAAVCAGVAPPVDAQSLPPYIAVNPVVTSRSGLYFQPYVDAAPKWQFRVLSDYANMVELSETATARLILDSEILRVDATAIRNVGRGFLGVSANFLGVYDGFLDGFLDWYHDFFGLQVAARDVLPRNQFQYSVALPDGTILERTKGSRMSGDLRFLAGHRHTRHWQTAVATTVPIGGGSNGYDRGVVSLSAVTTVRAPIDHRWTYEGSFGLGATPRRGRLSDFQQTFFQSLSSGLRYRFAGKQAAFVNLFYQSANYEVTGLRSLDQRELTLDYGFLLRVGNGPEWFLGMTEDLEPRGPAIDLSFRIGARW